MFKQLAVGMGVASLCSKLVVLAHPRGSYLDKNRHCIRGKVVDS